MEELKIGDYVKIRWKTQIVVYQNAIGEIKLANKYSQFETNLQDCGWNEVESHNLDLFDPKQIDNFNWTGVVKSIEYCDVTNQYRYLVQANGEEEARYSYPRILLDKLNMI